MGMLYDNLIEELLDFDEVPTPQGGEARGQ
jgi:hypothetical protein